MNLSKIEQETIISFNEGEETADVYTHNPRLKRRLMELHQQKPNDVDLRRADANSATYIIPKAWIRINPPRMSAPLSKEQIEKRKIILQTINAARISTSTCGGE